MGKLYTLKEAKELLGVTTKTIQRWDREGKIMVVGTIGGGRIPESEVKRILGLKEERVVVGYAGVSSAKR
jgi:putative resolvase